MVEKLTDPNKKGVFGQIAVLKDLTSQGFEVFAEIGDSSKVDLIILDENYKTYKLQVKSCNLSKGKAVLALVKKCLNKKYNSKYTLEQIDVFALYVIEKDMVIYISAKEALSKNTVTFSFEESKNKQKKKINFVENYSSIKNVLQTLR